MDSAYHSYRQEVEYLYSLQKFGIKFGLSTTSHLLQALGNPHHGPKYIHIAGTNGKGSVASFLSTILQKQGLKVGLYTSPHLVRFTERFQINSQEISQEKTTNLIQQLRQVFNPDEPPTFFEATTALALLYFAQEQTDIALIEVGMGGRLDATNIIHPLVSVITSISLEHQDFLGTTLIDIAQEKAGIIKQNVPVVTGVQDTSVLELFERICQQTSSPLYHIGRDFSLIKTLTGYRYQSPTRDLNSIHLGLKGRHQQTNAALALAVTDILQLQGIAFEDQALEDGLHECIWPGRMHIVSQTPRIVLDGAHNPQAIQALASSLEELFEYAKCLLVLGIMADKDIESILSAILPQADYVLFTRPKYERAIDPKDLMERARPWQTPGEVIASLPQALEKVQAYANNDDLILVCGSLFLVG
jgi:dihydrofolate synthase/folylpolyglutamate synthase